MAGALRLIIKTLLRYPAEIRREGRGERKRERERERERDKEREREREEAVFIITYIVD